MDFSVSTHRRHWLFNKSTLREMLEETTFLASEACAAGKVPEVARSVALKSSATDSSVSDTNVNEGGDSADKGTLEAEAAAPRKAKRGLVERASPLLSVEEEGLIKQFYERKIQETCGRNAKEKDLRRSDKVQASAVMYFKRFYLSNSVLEHDPKLLMLTCVFLASKTEEQMTNVSSLSKATGLDELAILAEELPLLQGLNFHLAVFHPYRAVPALVEGARLAAKEATGVSPPADLVKELHDRSRQALDDVLVTELPLLHAPSPLALAVVMQEGARMEKPPFDVMSVLEGQFRGGEGWSALVKEVAVIREELDKNLPYTMDLNELKAINKKLKAHALWSGGKKGGSKKRKKG